MKKTIIIVISVISSFIVVALTAFFIIKYFYGGQNGSLNVSNCVYDDPDSYMTGNARIGSEVKSIDIDWIAGKVIIEYSQSDSVSITETCGKVIEGNDLMRWKTDGDKLYVKYVYACVTSRVMPTKELTVTLPEKFESDNLTLTSSSADLTAEGLTTANLDVKTSSGKIKIAGTVTESARLKSSSGKIDFTTENCKTVIINSSSGKVDLSAESAETVTVSTSSGEASVNVQLVSGLTAHTSSGRISLTATTIASFADIDSSSGSVNLNLPHDFGMTLNYVTSSGKLYSELPLKTEGNARIAGDGKSRISVRTSSGNLYVNKTI